MDIAVKNALESLKKNNIEAQYFASSDEAVAALLKEIKAEESVGIGGSVTIKSLGIPEKLMERGNKVYYHWVQESPEKMTEARRGAMGADVYLTSTNALTEKGQIVNIDGVGNRVAAMFYGPKKVIIVCGINKLASDLHGALRRIKANAYKNARRLNLKTPCATTEKCNDCDSPDRMCSVTTIIEKKPRETQIIVWLIGEELGF